MTALLPREQLSLDLIDRAAPPETRADCAAIARPCNRYRCRYHLWVDTERRGRQHHGVAPAPTVSAGPESCALDVAERGGVNRSELVQLLPRAHYERLRQVEVRALVRVGIAIGIIEAIEVARGEFGGARIEVHYPPNNQPHVVAVEAHMRPIQGVHGLADWLRVALPAAFVSARMGHVAIYASS